MKIVKISYLNGRLVIYPNIVKSIIGYDMLVLFIKNETISHRSVALDEIKEIEIFEQSK